MTEDMFNVEEMLEASYKKEDANNPNISNNLNSNNTKVPSYIEGGHHEHQMHPSELHDRYNDQAPEGYSYHQTYHRRLSDSPPPPAPVLPPIQPEDLDVADRRSSREDSRRRRDRSRSSDRSSRRRRSRSRTRRHRSRSRSRRRSRDRSRRRYKDRSRERDRDRDRERDRERERSRSRDRTRRRSRSRRRSPSPVLSTLERDKRTVFVMQLAARVRPREVEDFFSVAGKVREVRLVTDRFSGRSKGIGYVEFHAVESVEKAITLSGQKLLGIPIIVQASEAEKNLLAEQAANANAAAEAASSKAPASDMSKWRLYVGSVHFSLSEDDVKQIFEPFGPVEFLHLHKDAATGRSKGYAFLQYKFEKDARMAAEQMNGFEIAGRQIKVSLVSERNAQMAGKSVGGAEHNLGPIDDEPVALTSESRLLLMQKLARNDPLGILPTATPVISQAPPKPSGPAPTRNVLLTNMFDPADETEPNWENEIKEDVTGECNKYGRVVHCFVDKDSQGHVYLKFDHIPASQAASLALNGRWFAGKQISASFISDAIYHSKFPECVYM